MAAQKQAYTFAALADLMAAEDVVFPAPIQIELFIQPERDMIKVKGRVEFALQTPCSRCLAVFDSMVSQGFTLRFSRLIPQDVHPGKDDGDIELTAQQIGLFFYEGDTIDLNDAVQEQIVMALPVKPICREDCKGLCPGCGMDLNHDMCQCADVKPAGPFDALKNFKF